MDLTDLVSTALVIVGLAAIVVSCIGIVTMRGFYARLHYVGPTSALAPVAIALAILIQEHFSVRGIKSSLVAFLIVATSPIVTHATARAARIKEGVVWTSAEGLEVGQE
jgi:monovalent cation/proton antiporter MnhG/PhaG subunit